MARKSYIRPDIVGGGEYDPMKEPRYAEIATFMRAPLARSLAEVDIGSLVSDRSRRHEPAGSATWPA